MKTLTINLAAKKPRYGKSFVPPVASPLKVLMTNGHRKVWHDTGVTEYSQCTIRGRGAHSRLDHRGQIMLHIVSQNGKQRFTFSGFVTKRLPELPGMETVTVIMPDGETVLKSTKVRGKWKVKRL